MPLFLLPFLSGAKSIVSSLFTFFSRPPGIYIAAAVALALGIWWWGHHEFNAGMAKCEAAHVLAAKVEVTRQQVVITKANDASDARTEKSATINASNQAKVIVIHDKADALPPAPECVIPPDIADGLRAIQ